VELTDYLKIKTPLLWVQTNEPERVASIVAKESAKDDMIYRMHPINGLERWVAKKGHWLKVLAKIQQETGDGEIYETEEPVAGFDTALPFLFKEGGTLIINNSHKIMEFFLPVFCASYASYRDAFFADDKAKLPIQFVLLSVEAGPPPELAEDCKVINFPLPTELELAQIAAHVTSRLPEVDFTEEMAEDVRRVVRAGLGMTEQEFINVSLSSVKEFNKLDPDFIAQIKLDKFKNNGLLEIRHPKFSLDEVGGMDLAKDLLARAVYTWRNPDKAAEFGITPLNRMLMVGVPGTGKSLICEAVAKTLGLELAKMSIGQFMSKWIGESEANIRMAFKVIRAMAPMVLWMDEFGRDASGGQSSGGDSGTTQRVHAEFLTGLQELGDNVFLMAAANQIDHLAPEMLRAERFDKIMFVGFPAIEERAEIFKIQLKDVDAEFDYDKLAEVSEMFTGAEIKSLISETRFRVSTSEARHISTDDLLIVAPTMKNRMWIKHRDVVLNMYRRAVEEWDWASSGQQAMAEQILGGQLGGFHAGPNVTKVKQSATYASF